MPVMVVEGWREAAQHVVVLGRAIGYPAQESDGLIESWLLGLVELARVVDLSTPHHLSHEGVQIGSDLTDVLQDLCAAIERFSHDGPRTGCSMTAACSASTAWSDSNEAAGPVLIVRVGSVHRSI